MEENQHSQDGFPPLVEFSRRGARRLLQLESILLLLLALYLSTSAIFKKISAPGALAGEISFSLFAAIGLFICSRAFAQRKAYGRAPALLANLIALGVAYFMISGRLIWVGTLVALLAMVTALCALLGYSE